MSQPSAPTASLTCSAMSFRWPDGTEVLDGLSLTVGRGRTGLIGANGSGKSTLLRILAGVLTPHSGVVTLDGRTLAETGRR
ncbi:ATP-binding cassette domain-containing protein, partial [Streptomyces sp. NRRL WC-3549]|uniref:ATP-binding cassette domain-containing protein n=1 Tax=Streptomyces sp. NRRL WC-3549 TaxID=1463925 RepID=UPI0005641D98